MLSVISQTVRTVAFSLSSMQQLGTKNSKSNQGRQEKNVGVKGRDMSAEEFDW